MKQNKNKGFTIIELLVIIAIIAILAATVMLALGYARQKARDTKRLADIHQFSTALELYYQDHNLYPVQTTATVGVPGLISSGYIDTMPASPLPPDSTTCSTSSGAGVNNDYQYTSADGSSYTLSFCLGLGQGSYSAGVHTLTPQGIQ